MTRLVRRVALIAAAAVPLTLTTGVFGSPHASSATAGIGSPFASGSGTCDPTVGETTFRATASGDYTDPLAELTTNGPATLEAYPKNVDTGGAGAVWGALGYPLAPGNPITIEVFCAGSPADVSYTLALYDAPSAPFTVSGAATSCPTCSSTNEVVFYPAATAEYDAQLTVTQGSVDLSNGVRDQVFTGSGNFDLGNYGHGHQAVYVTPQPGPTADWTLSIQALPVQLSGLKFDAPYIRPDENTTISYHVNGDVTLSAAIQSSSGAVAETLGTDLAVAAGDHTLTWNGLFGTGYPVPDGTYTVATTYTDAAGYPGSGSASIEVDGTPPVITPVSSNTIGPLGNLVINVDDALSHLAGATLSVDKTGIVQSLTSSGSQFAYMPLAGWATGTHTWQVTATDRVGNAATASGSFTTREGAFAPPRCHVPNLIGRKPKRARRAIRSHHCSVGRVRHRRSSRRLKGRVVSQRPRAGKSLRPHARVSFRIGLGRRPKRSGH